VSFLLWQRNAPPILLRIITFISFKAAGRATGFLGKARKCIRPFRRDIDRNEHPKKAQMPFIFDGEKLTASQLEVGS
jgi:hypothetical protein